MGRKPQLARGLEDGARAGLSGGRWSFPATPPARSRLGTCWARWGHVFSSAACLFNWASHPKGLDTFGGNEEPRKQVLLCLLKHRPFLSAALAAVAGLGVTGNGSRRRQGTQASPPRRAAGRPRTAPPSGSARGCSPASSSPPAAWCPGSAGPRTLREDRAQVQNSPFVFLVGNRQLSADVLGFERSLERATQLSGVPDGPQSGAHLPKAGLAARSPGAAGSQAPAISRGSALLFQINDRGRGFRNGLRGELF